MPNLILRPDWHLPESRVTPERAYRNRRKFLRELGLTGGGLLAAAGLLESDVHAADARQLYPAKRNIAFSPDLPLSKEKVFTTYNNFYEFGTDKEAVHQRVDKFVTAPWPVKIHGLCEKPVTLDAQELAAEFGLKNACIASAASRHGVPLCRGRASSCASCWRKCSPRQGRSSSSSSPPSAPSRCPASPGCAATRGLTPRG